LGGEDYQPRRGDRLTKGRDLEEIGKRRQKKGIGEMRIDDGKPYWGEKAKM